MVEILRKGSLPAPYEVPSEVREAATAASSITLREPRPPGFPLLFTAEMELIEPAVEYLHEHAIRRAHTLDTCNTYKEVLYDWFDALEQSGISWTMADAVDLIAYRNRMLSETSAHTGRPYGIRTINHRVRGVLRFYEWMIRNGWLRSSELVGRHHDFALANTARTPRHLKGRRDSDLFTLRQFDTLPRPLTSAQLRELLVQLPPPYDLMARWQLYTGLRVGELLTLTVNDVTQHADSGRSRRGASRQTIDIMRKGRKRGYVIAPDTLLQETQGYLSLHRAAWVARAVRLRGAADASALFVNSRGRSVKKNSYQQVIADTGHACGFRATTHLLRSTFACMMLARLERLVQQGAAINPLLIVKILMGHEQIDTTDRYLRAIAVDRVVLTDVLDSLLDQT